MTDEIMELVRAAVPIHQRNGVAFRRLYGAVAEVCGREFPRAAAPGGRQERPRQ